LFLPNWTTRASAGIHELICRTTLTLHDEDADLVGQTASTATTLEVVAATELEYIDDDAKAVGNLIAKHDVAMLGNSDEAARILSDLRDVRVIPLFIRELETNQAMRKIRAIRALAKFDDDRALAALKSAATTQPSDLDPEGYSNEALRRGSADSVRHFVAAALADSPHADATQLLISMAGDRDHGVRLTVAHRVAELEDRIAIPLLERLAADAHPMVAGEAKRYLAERP
ncbi:MAG: HEAT repeat domain-containing protein, partial [Polyangiaceae bacterium]